MITKCWVGAFLLLVGCRAETGCDELEQVSKTLYLGWPHTESCATAAEYLTSYGDISCQIEDVSTGILLHQCNLEVEYLEELESECFIYNMGNVSEDTPTSVRVNITADTMCQSQTVKYSIKEFHEVSCEEFINNATMGDLDSTPEGSRKLLECQAPEGTPEIAGLSITWYYECGDIPGGTVVDEQDRLHFIDLNHTHHPGVYSCTVGHNGMKRQVAYFVLCLEPANSRDVQLSCPTLQEREIGETFDINCTVDVNRGKIETNVYTMSFKKLLSDGTPDLTADNVSCTSNLDADPETAPDERVSCEFKYLNREERGKCFSYIPTKEEWKQDAAQTTKLGMTYSMKNAKMADFGKYSAFVALEDNLDINDTEVISIVEDVEHPERQVPIFVLCICVVAGLMVLTTVFVLLSVEVRWVWKHFLAPCEERNRPYDVYLSYFFDCENAKGGERLIHNVMKKLEDIGCTFFDNEKELGPARLNFDNIQQVQNECEWIIIILTRGNLLHGEMRRFEIYQNFLDKRTIFILEDESNAAIDELDERSRAGLVAAMRNATVINCSRNGYRRLGMRLELLLPKRFREEKAV